jgi:hypothetical protein
MNYLDTLTRFKNYSFDVQLCSVMLVLLFSSILLGQKFMFVQTLSLPLMSLVGGLIIWIYVKNQNIVRRGIGTCLIIILMCGTIFQGITVSHKIALIFSYPFLTLCLWEFTRVARNELKILVTWLFTFPLVILILGQYIINEKQQWIFLLAYPTIWIIMSIYANANVVKKAIKYIGFILVTLLVMLYLAIDIISLGFVEQLMKDPNLIEFFGSSETVPILHLIFTVFFVPFIVTCLICYFIADQRIKRISSE